MMAGSVSRKQDRRRREIFGREAFKILMKIAQTRRDKIENHGWTADLESIWERGTPSEWSAVLKDLAV